MIKFLNVTGPQRRKNGIMQSDSKSIISTTDHFIIWAKAFHQLSMLCSILACHSQRREGLRFWVLRVHYSHSNNSPKYTITHNDAWLNIFMLLTHKEEKRRLMLRDSKTGITSTNHFLYKSNNFVNWVCCAVYKHVFSQIKAGLCFWWW
jgi:hypothetical protein